jgi:hypothetical protein
VKARSKTLGDARPAFLLLVVPQLIWPEVLVEVEVIARRRCDPWHPSFLPNNSRQGRATGILFVTDPIADSFAQGVLNMAGLEDVSFEARVEGPPMVASPPSKSRR